MVAALLVLLTSTVLTVPPSEWKALDLKIPRHGTTMDCRFEVRTGSSVQVLLTTVRDAERFNRGRAVTPLYASGFTKAGHFRYRAAEAGDYVLIIDNRIEGRFPAEVELRIDLSATQIPAAQELPAGRRRAVVAISVFVFGLIVVYSARQFLRMPER